MKRAFNKRGQMQKLAAFVMGIASISIVIAITFLIISQTQQEIISVEGLGGGVANTTSVSLNATKTLAAGLDDIPGWVPLIVIAGIGAALIGLVALFKSKG